ncbi:hypothetical protein HY003_02395 [Candidatus Saccharibacteria bacterium]|nr:hypothetical protein [Candidatus Saccharibacteria bacterium]MBI3338126.1 hypothetical protein [Candidatus Saccharibacteria bacterium]
MNTINGMTFHRSGEVEGITVNRIPLRDTLRFAPEILKIMHSAYMRQFVEVVPTEDDVLDSREITRSQNELYPAKTGSRLSAGAVNAQFGPDNIVRQTLRMNESIKDGSTYWITRSGSYPNNSHDYNGVLKTSPSAPGKISRFFKSPNCFVNDMATTEEDTGIWSAMMFTGLSDFRDDRKVVTRAQAGNDVENSWLKEVGFEDKGKVGYLEIGGEQVGQYNYEAGSVSIVRVALLQMEPWLADGLPHPRYITP